MKRIIIIRSNPVNPDPRVEKEAHALLKNGFDVQILCWDRSEDYRENCTKIVLGTYKIPVTRIGCRASFGEGMKNITPFARFQTRMFLYLFRHRSDYDIIHACDFDTAFFSNLVSILIGKKFVFDIFDFLYGRPNGFIQRLVKKTQILLINHADASIICTEKRKKQIYGSHPKRLVVIHNTPDQSFFVETDIHTKQNMYLKQNDAISIGSKKVKVAYVGILQEHRLLKEITACIEKYPNIEFHIGGFGKYEQYMEEVSSRSPNIIWYGKLVYAETIRLEQESDIMLALYDPVIENHEYAAPNKFYEALMLGKPLIMVYNTGMSEIVSENDIGVLIDYSMEGFEEGLLKLIERKEEWAEMGERMKRIYLEQYSWEIMESRLIELYNELFQEKVI